MGYNWGHFRGRSARSPLGMGSETMIKTAFWKKTSLPDTSEEPREASKASWRRSAYLWVPLLALAVTLLVEMFNHKVFTTGFSSMAGFLTRHPLAFLVDILLVLLTMAPAFFLRRRVFWCTLAAAVWVIAGGVNGFILLSRMTPFTTADLTVLNTGLDTLPNYMSKGYITLLVLSLALLLAALIFLLIRGRRNRESLLRRLVKGIIAMAVTAGALFGCWTLAFQEGQLSTAFANLAFAYEDYGFPYCFLQTWLNKGVKQPVGYDKDSMIEIRERIQKNYGDAEEVTARTDVNVIYIQLESFIDPTEVVGLETNEDVVPVWHELEESFTSGHLTVPAVGAGTANTEFEVLTGMSSRMFGPGEYPYKTCLQGQTVESIAFDLKELGYGTHAIHNHRATFYTRNLVYANLGFDDFTSLEYMPKVKKTPKGWAKDSVLTNQILNALDATPEQPDLVFTVSVQGHGSYPTEPILKDPAITVSACPEAVDKNAIEYYLNQVNEMDAFVGKLIEKLSRRSEKTVLILYGDHLPSLNLEENDMQTNNLYQTEYVVWDNFHLRQKDQDITAYQLSAEVFKSIGISRGLVMKLHQFCQEEPTYRADLRNLQYDVLYGGHYLYGGGDPYLPTNMKMGVSEITVRGMSQAGDHWYVWGTNFSPFCKITVDGQILKTSYVNNMVLRLNEDPGTTDYHDLFVSVLDKHKEVLSDTELD